MAKDWHDPDDAPDLSAAKWRKSWQSRINTALRKWLAKKAG